MAKNETYDKWLGRSSIESDRLNSQHKLLKDLFGLLHPDIQALIKPDTRIAELATGTGIVLTELATELPSTCALHGFDISTDQFPPKDQTPPNITFHQLDAKCPPPEAFQAQYDILLIRYVNLGLQPTDWLSVATTAHTMLKPGGHIQWIEGNLYEGTRLVQAHPNAPCTTANKFRKLFEFAKQGFEFPSTGLRDVMESVFDEVEYQVASSDRDPSTRKAWTENVYRVFDEGVARILTAKGVEKPDEEAKSIISDLRAEEVYFRCDVLRFLGRKALDK